MSPVAHSDELSLQYKRTSSSTSKGRALHCTSKQTGSSHQSLILTSSPFNMNGRAPTTYKGLALHCTSKRTGSSLMLSLAGSPFNTGRRAPNVYKDKPFTVFQTDGLLLTIPIDETSRSTPTNQTTMARTERSTKIRTIQTRFL